MFRSPLHSRQFRRPRLAAQQRDGQAAVEAAICIPLVIILMLGTLEVCSGIYLTESLKISAFEAVRVGVRRRATAEDVRARAEEMLTHRQVTIPTGGSGTNYGITIEPSDFSTLSELDPIRVTITAPTTGNSLYIFDAFYNRNITTTVSMVREFDE